jgi:hypothetical protein
MYAKPSHNAIGPPSQRAAYWDGLHKGEIIVQTRSYLAVAGVTASTWRRMVPKRFQH